MLRLLLPFLTGAVTGEVGHAVRRTKRRAGFMLATCLFALAGMIFLLVTIYLALARHYGDIYAALMVAAGCFVVAIMALVAMKISDASHKRRVRERPNFDGSALLTAGVLAALPVLIKRPLVAAALPIIGLAAYALMSDTGSPRGKRRRDDRDDSSES
ncbi:hypothetical protein DUT91_10710 [Phyllobacterium salinisoli]|uniref:Phage holin family protein n=1 Tax=Phyllobacterium salinisoli TaxID=1899321 RepID=A0A368K2Y1_9HYPH|nr:phage holin family protein [Phyllobacterium salinisoli]RCS23749.1 hypothetical protein DUT91_10710 [Phyllobacterium salinisoli]